MGKAIKGRSIKIVRNENESSGYFTPQEIGDRKNGICLRLQSDTPIAIYAVLGPSLKGQLFVVIQAIYIE